MKLKRKIEWKIHIEITNHHLNHNLCNASSGISIEHIPGERFCRKVRSCTSTHSFWLVFRQILHCKRHILVLNLLPMMMKHFLSCVFLPVVLFLLFALQCFVICDTAVSFSLSVIHHARNTETRVACTKKVMKM